jgi:hypothetical protein
MVTLARADSFDAALQIIFRNRHIAALAHFSVQQEIYRESPIRIFRPAVQ